MSDYLFADDGKIHTRYTELVRCTAGQIDRVLDERLNPKRRFTSERLDFGSERHAMWEEESKRTGLTPECFNHTANMITLLGDPTVYGGDGIVAFNGLPVSHAEHEFVSELLPGVIVHSRPDAVCESIETIVDYKTLIADDYDSGVRAAVKMYRGSRQMVFYAFQLGLHGIRIKKQAYLIEIWNRDQEEIIGYFVIIKRIPFSELAKVLPWAKDRIAMLASAMEAL